ncbi:Rieske 2Fe-2S domain-containing protein [Dactylosporangium sp. CS-047395]|uniref:Rieske 2Fe-2S domain-containing protein n=1 Tax=Dactylosporangium sp. CS-047395 TaxID=3239936 RepID=UPI003D8BB51B
MVLPGHATAMRVLARLQGARSLDRIADAVRRAVRSAVGRGRLADLLHGRQLGHPIHPAMVQFPAGMSATVLDFVPGAEHAATALLIAGTAGTLPAAATGAADYATLSRRQRRVARCTRPSTPPPSACSLHRSWPACPAIGGGVRSSHWPASVSPGSAATLAGTSQVRWRVASTTPLLPCRVYRRDWQPVGAMDDFTDGQVASRTLGSALVRVYRQRDRFSVLLAQCAHRGGPLSAGRTVQVDGRTCVGCPWHGSVFDLADGRADRGPAGSDQVQLRSRVRDGRLEAARP